jgi:hypothetical protein
MADVVATVTAQALGIHQAPVHAYFIATKLDAFEIGNPIGFADVSVHYRRNLAAALPAFEIGNPIGFADVFTHYRRNLASALPAVEIGSDIGFGITFLRIPRIAKVFYPTVLVDINFGVSAGDSHSFTATRIDTVTKLPVSVTLTYSGSSEIIYNIPPHLSIRPRLLAPSNGSFHRTGVPVMIWVGTSQAIYYEVHVSRDIEFTTVYARFDTPFTEIQRWFPFGETFYWKVRAVAGLAYSDFSETWSFNVFQAFPLQDGEHDPEGRSRLLWQFALNH